MRLDLEKIELPTGWENTGLSKPPSTDFLFRIENQSLFRLRRAYRRLSAQVANQVITKSEQEFNNLKLSVLGQPELLAAWLEITLIDKTSQLSAIEREIMAALWANQPGQNNLLHL